MSSVIRRYRRKKSKADEFQLTLSASSLTIDCVKEKWHPNKLVIVWDKEKPKLSSTRPVPWQPGFKNPYRGIHVWPQPDPVSTNVTLFKNSDHYQDGYQDKPWSILVQNLSASGRHKVIATGQIDIADYISEERSSYDVTVTLRPVTKNVLNGTLEFSISSVLLEDGIPRLSDKEIFHDIMEDAIKSRKQSLQSARATNGGCSKSSLHLSVHKAPATSITAVEEKKTDTLPLNGHKKVCDPRDGASCSNSNSAAVGGTRKALDPPVKPPRTFTQQPLQLKKRSAPPPPPSKTRPAPPPPPPLKDRPAPPPPQQTKSQPASTKARPPRPPPPSQPKKDLSKTDKSVGQKGPGVKKEKYPKERNPFGSSSGSQESLNEETSPSSKPGQESGNQSEGSTSSRRRKRNRRKKKRSKYPKELNPFGGEEESNNEQDSSASEAESTLVRGKRNRRKKKAAKYPKDLNPFGGESDQHESQSSDTASGSCRESEKDSGKDSQDSGPSASKDLAEGDDKEQDTSNGGETVPENNSSNVDQDIPLPESLPCNESPAKDSEKDPKDSGLEISKDIAQDGEKSESPPIIPKRNRRKKKAASFPNSPKKSNLFGGASDNYSISCNLDSVDDSGKDSNSVKDIDTEKDSKDSGPCTSKEPTENDEKQEDTNNVFVSDNDSCSIKQGDDVKPILKQAKFFVVVEELKGRNQGKPSEHYKGDEGASIMPDQPVLKQAKPYVPVEQSEEDDEEKSLERTDSGDSQSSLPDETVAVVEDKHGKGSGLNEKGDDGHYSISDKPTKPCLKGDKEDKVEEKEKVDEHYSTPEIGASLGDDACSGMTTPNTAVEASSSEEDKPLYQEGVKPYSASKSIPEEGGDIKNVICNEKGDNTVSVCNNMTYSIPPVDVSSSHKDTAIHQEEVPDSSPPDMMADPSFVPDELVENRDTLAPPVDASSFEKDNPTYQEEASLDMAKPDSESPGKNTGLSSILENIVDSL